MSILENDVFRGSLFAVIGFIILISLLFQQIRHARYTAKVTAIITYDYRRGYHRGVYQPIYQYSVGGVSHKVASRWGHRSRIAKDGSEVTLYYIPGQPEKIYVPVEARTFLIFKIFLLFFGIVVFVLGQGVAFGLIKS